MKTQIKDRYGRIISVVFLDNQNINNELVRQCMALLYKKYTDNKILYELEAQAKNRRIGLWVDENPVAPWDWRRGKH
ncbi:thermonuclease family protein [Porticoccus sp.]|nr:thermonuclease family protein [Porticoccus sp.]